MKRNNNWNEIKWDQCSKELRTMQNDLAIEYMNNGYSLKCKQLQQKIVRSFGGRAIAVKTVVSNRGKKTPGIDGVKWDTSIKKRKAIEQLKNLKNYKANPVKRVYVEEGAKKRPLGISTMFDRAVQILWAQALDPIVETASDPRSFGFRKNRSVKDVATYIYLLCGQMWGKRYIGKVDIKSFFDTISHEWLLKNIPMNKKILGSFLKAGVIENNRELPTLSGVPQGGPISPIIANHVLNGLEQTVIDLEKTYIVRYADDFLIIGDNALTIRDKAIPKVKAFLNTRSLKINEEKSCMTDISKGFNYLGYHIREYPDVSRIKGTKQGIFLIKPTGENVKKVLRECRTIIKKHKNANAGFLIMKINPIFRGWAEHYRSVTSSRTFNKISRALFIMLWQWIKRKHRNVPKRVLSRRYFTKTVTFNPGAKGVNSKEKRVNRWVFFGKNDRGQEITLFQISSQNIKRHSMVSLTKPINPYLLKDQKEFIKRNQRDLNNTALIDNVRKALLKKQKSVCIHCGEIITSQDKIEIHHVIPIRKGGTDKLKNLQALHKECHNQITYSNN